MIKAEDFRIGNLIHHKNDNGIFKLDIIEVLAKGVNIIYNGGVWFIKYEALIPIPLTEELLLKSGAKKTSITSFWIDSYYLHRDATRDFWNIFNRYTPHPLREGIKYVHELQNWHFAWKGEELNIA